MLPSRTPSDSRSITSDPWPSSSQQVQRKRQRHPQSSQEHFPIESGGGGLHEENEKPESPYHRSSVDTQASSALASIPPGYESQISIPSNAIWRCSFCNNSYSMEYPRLDRPLGYFRCRTCRCVPRFEIYNIGRLQRIQGIEYGLVTPLDDNREPQTPHSIFVWVCCTCGRSWPQVPQPQRTASATVAQGSSDRGRLLRRVLRRTRGSSRDLPSDQDSSAFSATFVVTFNGGCLCAHYTCSNCFRAVVLAEGESILRRLQDSEVVRVSPERLQRKLLELREAGDDPDDYVM